MTSVRVTVRRHDTARSGQLDVVRTAHCHVLTLGKATGDRHVAKLAYAGAHDATLERFALHLSEDHGRATVVDHGLLRDGEQSRGLSRRQGHLRLRSEREACTCVV